MLLTVLCLTLLAATATSAETFQDVIANIRNTIKDIKGNCIQTERANENDLENILTGGKYTNNHNLKCAVKCLYVNTNIMTSDGIINEANMKLKTGTSNVRIQNSVFTDCGSRFTDSDLCERAYKISECTYRILKNASYGATWLDT